MEAGSAVIDFYRGSDVMSGLQVDASPLAEKVTSECKKKKKKKEDMMSTRQCTGSLI